LCTWIDDLAYTSGNDEKLDWFAQELNKKWSTVQNKKVKDCKVRLADFLVGCHVEQRAGKIKIRHRLLAEKLVEDLEDCNPIYTPFASGTEVSKGDCLNIDDEIQPYVAKYKSGTATVLYLACTSRPELQSLHQNWGRSNIDLERSTLLF